MSRWSYAPARVILQRRPDPTFQITWVLALSIPTGCAIVLAVWGSLTILEWLLLLAAGAGTNWALASADARQAEATFGQQLGSPLLAAASPALYLLVRTLHCEDLRAGRPLWVAVALVPPVLFIMAMARIGGYAMQVHGF